MHCPDCGGRLKIKDDKEKIVFKEGVEQYKCRKCGSGWKVDFGGVVPNPDGPEFERINEDSILK